MRPSLSLKDQFAAAQAWWREAGVDLIFGDEPRNWLRANPPEMPSSSAPPGTSGAKPSAGRRAVPHPPGIGGDPTGWPHDLPGFREWWLAEPSLDPGGTAPRVASRGEAGAELMVLVPIPEAEDRGLLLSGIEGRLVGNILAAMGLGEEATYLAAALPCYMAEPDLAGLGRCGLGAVLLHHLSLVRPKRLLVLGYGILPLIMHGSSQAPAAITKTPIQLGMTQELVPTLVSVAPALLLENARQRAMLWRRWLDWTDADR